MSAMRLFKADRKRKTWQLEFRDHRGILRQLSSRAQARATALAVGNRIEQLIDYRMRGDAPAENVIEWVAACHPSIRDKLLAWGIVRSRGTQEAEPLSVHVEAWKQSLLDSECTERYAVQSVHRVERVLADCGAERFVDIDADAILEALRVRRRSGASPRTCNFILSKLKQFCAWAKRSGRTMHSPLVGVKLYEERVVNTDIRRPRRALSLDEQRYVIAHTAKEPARWRMTGAERSLLYRFTLRSGLRAKEVWSLVAGSFALDDTPPTVFVRAIDSKHRKDDVLPLAPALVPLLREHLAMKLPDAPAWPRLHVTGYGKVWRVDLASARAAWVAEAKAPAERKKREQSDFLTYEDAAGRFADFHSLRHSFCTNLAQANTPPKTLQALARHADIRTTYRYYTHVGLAEEHVALGNLPSLDQADRGAERGAS